MTAGDRYVKVLRAPGVLALFAAFTLGRLPSAMGALALLVYLGEQTGSAATAGSAAAALGLGGGLCSPLQGRLIDRHGPRPVLWPLSVGHAAGLVALVAMGRSGTPLGVLLLLAGVTGAMTPSLPGAMRRLWPTLLGPGRAQLLAAALALDAISIELLFVAGPLIVALATSLAAPEAALLLGAACVLLGTSAFVAHPASRAMGPVAATQRPARGALASPGMRTVVACTVPLGFAFGAATAGLSASALDDGRPEAAGVLVAVWAGASACGGLAYGARSWGSALSFRWPVLATGFGVLFLPLAAAPTFGTLLAAAALAGLLMAPMIAASSELIGQVAPAGTETEAFTWGLMALAMGHAIGIAVAGVAIDAVGWRAAFLLAGVVGASAGFVALLRQERLQPGLTPTGAVDAR